MFVRVTISEMGMSIQKYSVRAYKTTDVKEDKLKKVLETATLSPSASNRQDWKFIVVRIERSSKKSEEEIGPSHFLRSLNDNPHA